FEVVSFLEGLGLGGGIKNDHAHSKFTSFLCWMSGRLNKDEKFPISWLEFAELYSSDSEAIESLPSLYNDFLNENSGELAG
ncbi:MAG TPA: hypothetical protein VEV84_06980, partial [Pyrinomonadaceae bacterium]|nr:hypothetical protein [Pyrinomonadaceae bacterium]